MSVTTTPHSHGAVVPQSSRAEWFTSFDVDAYEVPGGREEIWRFTPMRRLHDLHKGAAATGASTVDVVAADRVRVETVGRGDDRLGTAGVPGDRIAAQAWTSFPSATVITVPKEVVPDAPVTVTVTGPGEGSTAYGHLQVRAERFAQAVVVIDHRG